MQLAWQWQVVGWVPVSLDPALSPLALLTSFSPAYLTSLSMGLMVVFPNTFSMFLLSPSPSFLSLHQRHSGPSVHSLLLLCQVFPGSKDLPHACPAPLCHARAGLDKLPLSSTQICTWPYAWGREEPSSLLSGYNMQVSKLPIASGNQIYKSASGPAAVLSVGVCVCDNASEPQFIPFLHSH